MASSIRLTQRAARSSTALLAQSLTRQQCPRLSRSLPVKRYNSTTPTTSTASPAPSAPSTSAPATPPTPTPSSSSTSSSYSAPRTASYSASRAKILLYSTILATSGYLAYFYATDTRASVHQWLVPRLIRTLWPDAEDAHDVGVKAMKSLYPINLHVRERSGANADAGLGLSVFGHLLANPIGISAGLDKHADIIDPLFALGAGVVEVGGCTPLAQPGNPKPRMFRVPGIDGLINRYGLNSHGADDMAMRLRNRVRLYARANGLTEAEVLNGEGSVPPGSLAQGKLLAVQIAKNKDTPEQDVGAVSRDYTYCVSRLAPYADILVVNVSSPNTPGLRDLQAVEPLTEILSAVVDEARRADRKTKPKVMVKVSPDEDEEAQMEGIVQAVWRSGVDGVIVGNTTKRRVGVVPPGVAVTSKEAATLGETGGYSGPMMFNRTLNLVKRYRKMLDGQSLALTQAGADGKRAVHDEKKDIVDEAVGASLAGLEGTPTGMVEDDITTTPLSKSSTRSREAIGDGSRSQKVIFATGGISTGEQALQILNAGASLAMVYTGLVYGGAGTVTRIKGEMKTVMEGGNEKQA